MKSFKRTDRVGDSVRVELADILRSRVKDPRIGFVTITRVSVSSDLQHGKVWVSILDDTVEGRKRSLEGLNGARSFIRTELARRMRLRYTPDIEFYEDEELENLLRHAQDLEGGGGTVKGA